MLNIFKKTKKEEVLSTQETLATGEVINTDNEQGFVQGSEVYILSPEGDKVTLGDGEYILQDESSMVIKNGLIDSITPKENSEEDVPVEDSEAMAEEAPKEGDKPVEDAPKEDDSNDEIKKLDERITKLEELISKLNEKSEEVKAENENLKKEVVELSKQPAAQSISVETPVSKPYEEMSAFEKYQYNKKSYGF